MFPKRKNQTLKELKASFIETMNEVSEIIGLPPSSLRRDDYVRVTVDFGIQNRLNKEQLNLLGGFKVARDSYFTPETLSKEVEAPKVLVLDIETAPLLGYVWGLWENNVGLNQIYSDWYVLSWSAKWLDSDEVMYMDQRHAENIEDDREIIEAMWKLLDEADVIITQNGKRFDKKKLNARFVMLGLQPPSSYGHVDTKQIASRHFAFTSNKLEYMTDKMCTKYKKSKHQKFVGFALWRECLKGNMEAWKEMEEYNRLDVLSLQELYEKLIPWDNTIDFNLYNSEETYVCRCGSVEFRKAGFHYTQTGKHQKYVCKHCGTETRSAVNLYSKEKRKSLRRRVPK